MSKPKLVQRLVGVVAAAALSVGLGAVGTAPAAASAGVWDRVASCESGGNWKINTGNGYYGGLQFSRSTWRAYGGGAYASTANRATKAQQIAIARRTLASQGPGAWPVCSRKAGLTRSNGGANRHATASSSSTASRRAPARVARTATVVRTTYTVSSRTITVKRGDTLIKIASRYHVRGGWRGLWQLNRSTVSNPNVIRVGQVLRVK